MNRIRVGVVGTGFMGTVHTLTLRRIRNVDVCAIADYSLDSAREKAQELGVPSAYGSYQDLIDNVDVVHNCTPNHMHYEVSKAALQAGKHVFSEKPLAIETKQAVELLELATRNNLHHGINFVYRYYPMVQHAKKTISDGGIGDLRVIRGAYMQDWLAKDTDFNWRISSSQGGKSRALADIGSHWCDLIQYVTGRKITAVFGDIATIIKVRKRPTKQITTFAKADESGSYVSEKADTEDYASVLFELDDGSRGVFTVSQVSFGHKNQITFEISGSAATLAWNNQHPEQIWFGLRDEPNREIIKDPAMFASASEISHVHMPGGHGEGWLDNFTNLLTDFYDAVSKGLPASVRSRCPSFADGVVEMKLVDAMLSSHKLQKWVRIDCERRDRSDESQSDGSESHRRQIS